MRKYLVILFAFLSLSLVGRAGEGLLATDSLYMGTIVKFDIASPIVIPATTGWGVQNYEIAANVRLAKRFYPTLELGYTGGTITRSDTVAYRAQGGFFRIGADINPLKKHPESPHALLVGLRFGTGVQSKGYTDCWGEIVAGCQVEIAQLPPYKGGHGGSSAFYMGWMGRFKVLFTRQARYFPPEYIPGFGYRNNLGWGLNYYLGWRF